MPEVATDWLKAMRANVCGRNNDAAGYKCQRLKCQRCHPSQYFERDPTTGRLRLTDILKIQPSENRPMLWWYVDEEVVTLKSGKNWKIKTLASKVITYAEWMKCFEKVLLKAWVQYHDMGWQSHALRSRRKDGQEGKGEYILRGKCFGFLLPGTCCIF